MGAAAVGRKEPAAGADEQPLAKLGPGCFYRLALAGTDITSEMTDI